MLKRQFSTKILRPVLGKPWSQLPMDQPLPGLPSLRPASALKTPETEITTLKNGLRVVTQETYGQSSTLGLFIDAGSTYEDASNYGVSHMIEHLCFKSTRNRTHAEIVRRVEDIGGQFSATAGREQIVLSIDILRDYVPEGLELLWESIREPLLVEAELEQIRRVLRIELETLEDTPPTLLQERIHAAAYGPLSPLGHSLQAPENRIDQLTADTVRDYLDTYFQSNRMVLAGAGVEHGKMVQLAQDLGLGLNFDGAPKTPTLPISSYTGGDVRIHKPDAEFSYATLAFETGGWHSEDLVPVCVLQMLLGGGDSFSAGGPGKGMYSRLYTQVLNRYYWVESAQAFTSIHARSGLLGITGASTPAHTSNLIAVLCNQMVATANSQVDELELSRAKNQLKSSVWMNLESRMILYEDIGRQLLTYNRRDAPEDICALIDQVSPVDIQRVAQKALNKPPSLVVLGDLSKFPSLEQTKYAIEHGLQHQ